MSVYRTGSGGAVTLGREIGRGGEGSVHTITGESDRVAKIYLAGKERERQDKIRAMVADRLSARSNLVAFPAETLSDAQGRFSGFTMRFASGSKPIHELYSPKSRKTAFPDADFRFIARTATNAARAVASVHATGCVIGDINRSGFLINNQALVTLIDADSFQVTSGGTTYRCRVAVPEYTPPELQLVDPASIDRTPQHDAFGLAVILFQLLFAGRHPYAGAFNGPSDGSLDEAIRQGRFAYSLANRAQTKTAPPKRAALLSDFPKDIADAFERAFATDPHRFGQRPTADEWVRILHEMEGNLVPCAANARHHYPSRAFGCPWCRIEAGSTLRLFEAGPSVSRTISAPPPPVRPAPPSFGASSASAQTAQPASRQTVNLQGPSLQAPASRPGLALMAASLAKSPPRSGRGRKRFAQLGWLLAIGAVLLFLNVRNQGSSPSEPETPAITTSGQHDGTQAASSPAPTRIVGPRSATMTPSAEPAGPAASSPSSSAAAAKAAAEAQAKADGAEAAAAAARRAAADANLASPAPATSASNGPSAPTLGIGAPAAPTSLPAPPPQPLSPAEVARLQAALAALGFDAGPIDGVSGGRTNRAIQQYAASRSLDGNDPRALLASAEGEARAVAAAAPPAPASYGAASYGAASSSTVWPGFRANGIRLSPAALSLFSMDEAVDIQMAMLAALNQPGASDARTSTSDIRVTGYRMDRNTPCKTAAVALARQAYRPLQMTFCLGGDNAWTDIGG